MGGTVALQVPGVDPAAFGSLFSVGGDLSISNAAGLIKLAGFRALTTVGGDLNLDDNDSLVFIDFAFPRLTGVGGTLSLSNNPRLVGVVGSFTRLAAVGRSLLVEGNAMLSVCALGTLNALATVDQDLSVQARAGSTCRMIVRPSPRIASDLAARLLAAGCCMHKVGSSPVMTKPGGLRCCYCWVHAPEQVTRFKDVSFLFSLSEVGGNLVLDQCPMLKARASVL